MIRYLIWKYLLPFSGLSFHSPGCDLWCTKVFNFDESDSSTFLFLYFVFFLIRGYYFYNIVMVFTIHQRESALGIHMSPPSWTRLPLSPHSTPLGCHRVLALGSLHFTSNSHWHSILHMVMYMFQCYSLFCCLCLWCQN